MKSSNERSEALRRQRSRAVAESHITAIFQRMPMLSGFSLGLDLEVTDIEVSTWPGQIAGREFYEDLVQALAEVAEKRPDAVETLRGRTFARTFQ